MEPDEFSETLYNFLKNAGAFSHKICDISQATCANEHIVSAVLNKLLHCGIVVKDEGNPPKWRVNKRSLNYTDVGPDIHRPKLQSIVQNIRQEPKLLRMSTPNHPPSAQFYNSYNDLSAPEVHRGPCNDYSPVQTELLAPTKKSFSGKKAQKMTRHFPKLQGNRYIGRKNFRTTAGKQNFQKSVNTRSSPPHAKSRSQVFLLYFFWDTPIKRMILSIITCKHATLYVKVICICRCLSFNDSEYVLENLE